MTNPLAVVLPGEYNSLRLNQEVSMSPLKTITEEQRKEIAQGLSVLLADSYTLYLKTHNYHWNVTGPMFQTLHLMFEQHYTELALAVDLIAERIRALGQPAPVLTPSSASSRR
jgi:DNA-binding ferritin-like protein